MYVLELLKMIQGTSFKYLNHFDTVSLKVTHLEGFCH